MPIMIELILFALVYGLLWITCGEGDE